MKRKIFLSIALVLFFTSYSIADLYYVSITGNDGYGDGSADNPWRTLRHAVIKTRPNEGHTIIIGEGTFIEQGQIKIPPGINIQGSGKNTTVLKAASSFYYHPETPAFAIDKFLVSLKSSSQVPGNQHLKDFTIDGDSKQLHGGIYIRYRTNVILEGVVVQNTNFNGIWLWDVKDSKIKNTALINCSWGSNAYCAGALHLGNIERVEIDQLRVDENVGYGIKAIGPSDVNSIQDLKIHDSHISVNPEGLWNNGLAPNIAIELFQDILVGCEIYNSYVDNTISVVTNNRNPPTGVQAIRIHHNTIDIASRSKGAGYGIELTMHDAEIDHNYFIKGSYGIANWVHAMENWDIHHNVFYALEGIYPGDIVRSQESGLHHVNFYNNTIEFTGEQTMNVIGLYGGTSENLNIINNLFINNNTGYSYYPNALVHTENGSVVNNLVVKNNFFDSLAIGNIEGTYSGNLEGDPLIYKNGERPDPYYQPKPKSDLLGAGLGSSPDLPAMTPDIGAFGFDQELFNEPPRVTISKPASGSEFFEDSAITVSAEAYDSTGTIDKVQFFNGVTSLGEDVSAPYSFTTHLRAGSYSLRALATDNFGAADTSAAVTITVVPSVKLGLYAPDASLSGHMSLTADSTALKGSYFSIPAGYGTNYTLGASNAQFNFELERTDDYTIWVRIRTMGPEHQAYHIYDGKGNWTTWWAGHRDGWQWVKITDAYTNTVANFPFTKGPNVLVFSWLHDDVHVDQAIITNNADFHPEAKSGLSNARANIAAVSPVKKPQIPETTEGLAMYPNPVKDAFTLSYNSPVAQQAEIKIMTMTSLIAKQVTVYLKAGPNVIEMDSENIERGIYILSFITSTGEAFEVKTVVSK